MSVGRGTIGSQCKNIFLESECVLTMAPEMRFSETITCPVTAVGSGGRRNTGLKFIRRSLES
jgi:hypothetical protein